MKFEKDRAVSIGAMVLAFLASQHHTLHMLLLLAGLGSGSMSAVIAVPLIRRAMLLVALVMVGVMAYQLRQPARAKALRVMNAVSILVTLGFVAWSVVQFGI